MSSGMQEVNNSGQEMRLGFFVTFSEITLVWENNVSNS